MKFKSTNTPGGMIVELGPEESRLPATTVETSPAVLPTFKLKKVLVPVDFSECSLKALQYAVAFATQFDAELVLIHVVESYLVVPEMGAVDVALIQEQMRTGAKEELEKLCKRIDLEHTPKAELRMGNPASEVVQAAKDLEVDLVVVSTHGRTGLAHVFLGSVAESIVRHATCPVLVVRENEHEFVNGQPKGEG